MLKNILIIWFLSATVAFGQHLKEPVNNVKVYEKALELYQQEKYAEALKEFESIDRNDTIYADALLQRSLTYLKLENFEEGIRVCKEGILLKSSIDHNFRINLGVILNSAKRHEEALAANDEGIKIYPKNHLFYYNKGIVYKDMNRGQDAIRMYKEAVLLNPYHVNSHLNLGILAAEEGKISQAVMSFTTAVILEPNTARSLSILGRINEIVSSKYERNPMNLNLSPEGGDDFEETDIIISNYAALSKDFKIPVKVDLPAIKQCYALFTKIEYDKNDKGFWMQTYVPLFKEIMKQNMFPAFTYYVLQPSTNDMYIKIVKKNYSKVKQFTAWVPDVLNNMQKDRVITFNGKVQEVQHFYHSKTSNLEIVGNYNNEKKKFTGDVEIYYNNGALRSKGAFNTNEEKEGVWSYYDSFGNLLSQGTYKKNIAEGPFKVFYPDGTLKKEGTNKAGVQEGVQKEYNRLGKLETLSNFKNDLFDGDYSTFYAIGEEYKHYIGKYSAGKLIDTVFEYYDNGKLASKRSVAQNLPNHYSTYHRNGQLALKTNQLNNKYDGPSVKYDWHGKIQEEGSYKEGNAIGKWLTYENGKLIEESFFDEKGKKKGFIKNYDSDGKIYSELEFANGLLIGYKYLDKNGKIIKEEKNAKGELNFTGFTPEGKINREGKVISAGKRGVWKYYDEYGNLKSEESFNEKGNLAGKARFYYINGNVSDETSYDNGTREGLYASFYTNGKIKEEGWFKEGIKQSYWNNYRMDGTIKSRHHYINDNLVGWQQYYRVSGKLDYEEYIKEGMLQKVIFYDSKGKISGTNELPNGTGKNMARYENNNVKYDLNYILGIVHGKATWYHFNGKVNTEGNFHNGERQGIWKWYDENGKLTKEGRYENGEKDGKWISYKNGKINSEDNYVNGSREGDRILYYENGKVMVKRTFENNLDEGKAFYYDETGELQYAKIYHKGKYIAYTYFDKNGQFVDSVDASSGTFTCVAYFKNGKKSIEYNYVKGDFNGFYTEYFSNGNIMEQVEFKDGDYHGTFTGYYPDGKLKSEFQYAHGDLHGTSKSYYPDGKLERKEQYLMGNLQGESQWYNKSGKVTKRVMYDDDDVVNHINL